jgi:hypothetical protein
MPSGITQHPVQLVQQRAQLAPRRPQPGQFRLECVPLRLAPLMVLEHPGDDLHLADGRLQSGKSALGVSSVCPLSARAWEFADALRARAPRRQSHMPLPR